MLTFAFLPVIYSRIAVTDVGTFLPVALAMYGALRVYEEGRLKHYLLAAAGIGLATGFKYTAGLVLLPLVLAAVIRFVRDRETPLLRRRDLRYLVFAGALTVLAFGITTPFFFVHPRRRDLPAPPAGHGGGRDREARAGPAGRLLLLLPHVRLGLRLGGARRGRRGRCDRAPPRPACAGCCS